MVLVVALVVVGVVLAIAAAFVIREAGRLAQEPPPPVFDADEAHEWAMQRLPDDVAASLTPDDLHRILGFHLEYLESAGVTGNGSSHAPPGAVVVGGHETVAHVLARAEATGEPYLPEQVEAVVAVVLEYLLEIGAVSGPAGRRPARPLDDPVDPGPADPDASTD